jgi:leader peptidase (prepilin peptidase)/N-methyltransferase
MPAWLQETPGLTAALIVLGLCLGSFLNVVIHRLPRGLSLRRPRSFCPQCRTPLAWWDNLPLLSYAILRGRCRRCRARIPLRYPLVELSGAACLLLGSAVSAAPSAAAVRCAFLLALVVVFFVDLDHRIIPDGITLPGIVLGLAVSPLIDTSRQDAVIGVLVGMGGLLLVAAVYRAVRGIEGMGGGDFKLAGLLGAFLGWQGVLLSLLFGSLLGALFGMGVLLSRRGTMRTALPFGSFLAPAAAAVVLYGRDIWNWYLNL